MHPRRRRGDHGHPASRRCSGQTHDPAFARVSTFIQASLPATAVTVRTTCGAGLSIRMTSSGISTCSTNRLATTAPSRAPRSLLPAQRRSPSHSGPSAGPLVSDHATLLYGASEFDCAPCPLKARGCPNELARKVPRSIPEGAWDMARSNEVRTTRRERTNVEMLFARLERKLTLDRFRLFGPNGARDKGYFAAATENLRSSPES